MSGFLLAINYIWTGILILIIFLYKTSKKWPEEQFWEDWTFNHPVFTNITVTKHFDVDSHEIKFFIVKILATSVVWWNIIFNFKQIIKQYLL